MENQNMKGLLKICAALSCLLAGCTVGPNYRRPAVPLPPSFSGNPGSASLADRAWWEMYPDAELGALIKEALSRNNDLRAAAARVEEAREYAAVARSEYFPGIAYDLGAQRDRGVFKYSPNLVLPTEGRTQNLFLGGLSATWEADVWGRIRRSNEAALADFLATGQGRRGLLLSLASDIAQFYFELQELDRRLEIASKNAAAFEATYALFQRRFSAGITSRLAVTRAESAWAEASGVVTEIARQIAMKEHQICVLLGRNPGPIPRRPQAAGPVPQQILAGLPSALLERRPDLLQAEQALAAASARIGVAQANWLPKIGLTTLFGRVSPQLSALTLGSATVSALAASSSGPIFTGGRLKGRQRVSIAIFEQARFEYLQAVVRALQEVSDALVSIERLRELEGRQQQQTSALAQSVSIANKRYLGGLASYYEVLEAQQLLFPAEIALSVTRRNRLLAIVQLYKALGGGWKLTDAQWVQGHP